MKKSLKFILFSFIIAIFLGSFAPPVFGINLIYECEKNELKPRNIIIFNISAEEKEDTILKNFESKLEFNSKNFEFKKIVGTKNGPKAVKNAEKPGFFAKLQDNILKIIFSPGKKDFILPANIKTPLFRAEFKVSPDSKAGDYKFIFDENKFNIKILSFKKDDPFSIKKEKKSIKKSSKTSNKTKKTKKKFTKSKPKKTKKFDIPKEELGDEKPLEIEKKLENYMKEEKEQPKMVILENNNFKIYLIVIFSIFVASGIIIFIIKWRKKSISR